MADYKFTIINKTLYEGVIVKKDEDNFEPGVTMNQSDWSGDKDPEHQLESKIIPPSKNDKNGVLKDGILEVTLYSKMGRNNPWFSFDIELINNGTNGNARLTITPQLDQNSDANTLIKNSDKIEPKKGLVRRNYIDSGFTATRECCERKKEEDGTYDRKYILTINNK